MEVRFVNSSEVVLPAKESRSLIIHAQDSCPYAKCSYCPQFGEVKTGRFKIRDFERYIEEEAKRFPPYEIRSIFISEGNTISMEVKTVVAVLKALYRNFPFLEGVSVYGSAQSVLARSPQDLRILREHGLTRIHMGLESGSDRVLLLLNKGVDAEGMVKAAGWIKDAGVELFVYVLISGGGRYLSLEHVENTVEVVNGIAPHSVDMQTLVPVPRTPLYDQIENGDFELLSPHETIKEIRYIIEGISVPVEINCDHISNYCYVHGRLPEDRERLIMELDYCLTLDELLYSEKGITNIKLPS